MLAECRRLGLAGRDEVWQGALHMVLPPRGQHQRTGTRLMLVLGPLAEALDLVRSCETGLFRAADDHRVPDQLYCRPEHASERGAEGAELVVEIRSAADETYAKFDFYAAAGVRELLVVHPEEQRVELFRLVGARLLPVSADAEGGLRSDVLGVRFTPVDGGVHLGWSGGTATL